MDQTWKGRRFYEKKNDLAAGGCGGCVPAPVPQSAADRAGLLPIPDLGRECTLTLQHKFPGTTFDLYRIASVTREAAFTLVPDLSGCNVRLSGLDQAGWRAAALALAGYVEREALAPLRTGQTGEDGTLAFEALPTGLYLVVGRHETREGMSYHFTPFLICLPNWLAPGDDPEGEKDWTYEVTAAAKYEEREPEQEMRRVLKIWNDGGQVQDRPPYIVVDLLRDQELYDTVVLSADSGWRHVWEELDTSYDWRVGARRRRGLHRIGSV